MKTQPGSGAHDRGARRSLRPLIWVVILLVLTPLGLQVLAAQREGGVAWLRTVSLGAPVVPTVRDGNLLIIKIARFLSRSALEDKDVVSIAWFLNYFQDTIFFIVCALLIRYFFHLFR